MGKKPDWNEIRAEYISGGISQRKLAVKYGIPVDTVMRRANREKWNDQRTAAYSKATEIIQQKTAAAASSNAAMAQRIREKLIKKLEKEIDELPASIGSETRQTIIDNEFDGQRGNRVKRSKEISKAYKLVELANMYEKLTKDLNVSGDSDAVRIIIDV